MEIVDVVITGTWFSHRKSRSEHICSTAGFGNSKISPAPQNEDAKSKIRPLEKCVHFSMFDQKSNLCNNHIYHFHASESIDLMLLCRSSTRFQYKNNETLVNTSFHDRVSKKSALGARRNGGRLPGASRRLPEVL